MRTFTILAAAAMSVLAAPAFAASAGGSVLIQGARIFDGERAIGSRDVLVQDGRIAAIGERLSAPRNVARIDGRGKTLMPGLMDSHVHVFPTAQADALRFGVTTEFDMFTMADPATVAARKAQRASYDQVREADTWSAGIGITPPGGHPAPMMKGMGVELPTLDDAEDADAFVAEQAAAGSDYIKIFQDDGTAHGGPARLTPFGRERLRAVIAAAHKAGRKAIVHVSKMSDARDAIEFGADAIAHLFQDEAADKALVALARAKGATVIATASVLAGASGDDTAKRLAADPAIAPFLSPPQKGMMAGAFPKLRPVILPRVLESIRRLNDAGVVVLAGTDAPNPSTAHGPTLHEELELLVRAGMTPSQALAAATSRPADFFGTADRGRIGKGLRADLVLVEGDPTTDILATRRIAGIWKNGYPVDRTAPVVDPRGPAPDASTPESH